MITVAVLTPARTPGTPLTSTSTSTIKNYSCRVSESDGLVGAITLAFHGEVSDVVAEGGLGGFLPTSRPVPEFWNWVRVGAC